MEEIEKYRTVNGASAMRFKELAKENQISYRNHIRMSIAKFEELLQMDGLKTQCETVFRTSVPARRKLELIL